jgi:hypothetical protein
MPAAIAALHPRLVELAVESSGPLWLRWLRGTMASLCDPYRPERHYMRGPGPKWRAKHGIR